MGLSAARSRQDVQKDQEENDLDSHKRGRIGRRKTGLDARFGENNAGTGRRVMEGGRIRVGWRPRERRIGKASPDKAGILRIDYNSPGKGFPFDGASSDSAMWHQSQA